MKRLVQGGERMVECKVMHQQRQKRRRLLPLRVKRLLHQGNSPLKLQTLQHHHHQQ